MRRLLTLAVLLVVACGPSRRADVAAGDGAVASPSSPGVLSAFESAQIESARTEAQMVRSAAEMYVVSKQACPSDVAALVEAKVLQRRPPDPWGHDYMLECSDMGAKIRVSSVGLDGRTGTADDIVAE